MKKNLNYYLLLALTICFMFLLTGCKTSKNDSKEQNVVEEQIEEPKEKVDIIDINSKTRPLAVMINNTPVAVKVQNGLGKAYIVYEIPTEFSTSRLMALYKDVEDTKLGTIRSSRHNFLDFAYESDAIYVSYGWSHYAEDELRSHAIDYIQGIEGEADMWRENPEGLAYEHTVYTTTDRLFNYARDTKHYAMESDNTILLNYNVGDVDLSEKEGVRTANKVTIPYGSVTTVFAYNEETKEYSRIVNGVETSDYFSNDKHTTKNIIVEKVSYNVMGDGYYWNLHTVGSGDGYYITNGKAVPIKWSKADRKAKTKYTYLDGTEIEVSDGRTYIEVQVSNLSTTIE